MQVLQGLMITNCVCLVPALLKLSSSESDVTDSYIPAWLQMFMDIFAVFQTILPPSQELFFENASMVIVATFQKLLHWSQELFLRITSLVVAAIFQKMIPWSQYIFFKKNTFMVVVAHFQKKPSWSQKSTSMGVVAIFQ